MHNLQLMILNKLYFKCKISQVNYYVLNLSRLSKNNKLDQLEILISENEQFHKQANFFVRYLAHS